MASPAEKESVSSSNFAMNFIVLASSFKKSSLYRVAVILIVGVLFTIGQLFLETDSLLWIFDSRNVDFVNCESIQLSRTMKLECLLREKNKIISSLQSKIVHPALIDYPEIHAAINASIHDPEGYKQGAWQRWLPADDARNWRQHTFKPHGSYGFIQFSGYRLSSHSFVAVGLASSATRKTRFVSKCYWVSEPENRTLIGNLSMHFQSELENSAPLGLQYEVASLICTVPFPTSNMGGTVIVEVDYESIVVFREDPLPPSVSLDPPADDSGLLPYNLAYCGAGWHGNMDPAQTVQWMEYHRVLFGVSHFYLYDAGAIRGGMKAALEPYERAGLVTVTGIRHVLLLSIKFWGQPLANADCVYRTRSSARWLLFMDVDEYLKVIPPHTLPSLLAAHSNYSWLSHGSYNWNISLCVEDSAVRSKHAEWSPASNSSMNDTSSSASVSHSNSSSSGQSELFAVERMWFREGSVHCKVPENYSRESCPSFWGHRKLIVNPRKIHIPETHDIFPAENGVDLNAYSQLVHHHYRGLGVAEFAHTECRSILPPLNSSSEGGYVIDTSVAKMAWLARRCPLGSTEQCGEEVRLLLGTLAAAAPAEGRE